MQLTVRLFGLEMLHIELSDPEGEPDNGYLGSTPVGFTARMDVPEDLELPCRE